MRTILVSITKTVAVEVPDESWVTASLIARIARWKLDDTTDGRRPFSTELIEDGVSRGVDYAVDETVFHLIANLPRYRRGRGENLDERNALVEKECAAIKRRPIYGLEIRAFDGVGDEGICRACGMLSRTEPADDGLVRCNQCGMH
jgi:hypothetical protein